MSRLTPDEESALKLIRSTKIHGLDQLLSIHPPYPDVIGDRRLLRFYIGYDRNMDKTLESYAKYLQWRLDHGINDIRNNILYGQAYCPANFPHGSEILKLMPMIVLSGHAYNKLNQPLWVERFNFELKHVLSVIKMEEFYKFMDYALEYRSLALEQISELQEREYIAQHPNPSTRSTPYRVLQKFCSLKDLKGINSTHFGVDGRTAVKHLTSLIPYYPEHLGVCYIVNTPWIFNTFWFFVKGLLDASVIAKVKIGVDPLPLLIEGLTIENIPDFLGGHLTFDVNDYYKLDVSKNGPFWYEGCPLSENRTEKITVGPRGVGVGRTRIEGKNVSTNGDDANNNNNTSISQSHKSNVIVTEVKAMEKSPSVWDRLRAWVWDMSYEGLFDKGLGVAVTMIVVYAWTRYQQRCLIWMGFPVLLVSFLYLLN